MFISKFRTLCILFITLILYYPNVSSANNFSDSINYLISKTSDRTKLLQLYDTLSIYYINTNDTNSIQIAKIRLELALNSNDPKEICEAYETLAFSNRYFGNVYEAIDLHIKELTYREKIDDKKGLAFAYKNLGECYRGLFEYINAFHYLNNSYELYKKLDDKNGLAAVLNRLGAVYYEFNKSNDTTLNYAIESNKYATEVNNLDILSSNYLTIGSVYLKQHDIQKGLSNLFKSLNIIENLESQSLKSLVLKDIADGYSQVGDFTKAINYANRAYQEAIFNNVKVYQWLSAKALYINYEKIGKVDSAYKYLKLTTQLGDLLYNNDKEKLIYQIESKYQREQYQKSIESQNEQKKMIYIIYTITIISILIILALIIFRYKKLRIVNKQLEKKRLIIESQKEELSKSNATKDKFFTILSHDLKSPISSFNNLAEILADDYKTLSEEERINHAKSLKHSSTNVLKLLEGLLAWSLTQTQKLEFYPENIELNEHIKNEISTLQEAAELKNIQILFNDRNPSFVFADPEMVSAILRNLINNSIKFTNINGKININLAEKDNFFEIEIKDNGVGISESDKEKLFKIDVKHSTCGTNSEKGAGIGLHLCKELVLRNNGKIYFESKIDSGSSFFFTLPKAILD